jgi:hypothetical protein
VGAANDYARPWRLGGRSRRCSRPSEEVLITSVLLATFALGLMAEPLLSLGDGQLLLVMLGSIGHRTPSGSVVGISGLGVADKVTSNGEHQ